MLPSLARSSGAPLALVCALGRRPQPSSSVIRRSLSSQLAVRRYTRKVSGNCAGAQPSSRGVSAIIRRMRSHPDFDVYVYAFVLSLPIYAGLWKSYTNSEEEKKESKATLDEIYAQNELIRMKYRQAASTSSPIGSNTMRA
jgi:hypothetical protein